MADDDDTSSEGAPGKRKWTPEVLLDMRRLRREVVKLREQAERDLAEDAAVNRRVDVLAEQTAELLAAQSRNIEECDIVCKRTAQLEEVRDRWMASEETAEEAWERERLHNQLFADLRNDQDPDDPRTPPNGWEDGWSEPPSSQRSGSSSGDDAAAAERDGAASSEADAARAGGAQDYAEQLTLYTLWVRGSRENRDNAILLRQMLRDLCIAWEETDMDNNRELQEQVEAIAGVHDTFPLIFVNERYLCTFNTLRGWFHHGKLERRLRRRGYVGRCGRPPRPPRPAPEPAPEPDAGSEPG